MVFASFLKNHIAARIISMTRSDLIAALADRFPNLTTADAESTVKEILGGIGAALAHGDRVEVRGFGSFTVNYRPPRTGRNPKTGEKVSVPAKYVPHFKAGKDMRGRVDEATESAPLRRVA